MLFLVEVYVEMDLTAHDGPWRQGPLPPPEDRMRWVDSCLGLQHRLWEIVAESLEDRLRALQTQECLATMADITTTRPTVYLNIPLKTAEQCKDRWIHRVSTNEPLPHDTAERLEHIRSYLLNLVHSTSVASAPPHPQTIIYNSAPINIWMGDETSDEEEVGGVTEPVAPTTPSN